MNKDQKILSLYRQRKNEGLTALALICGYSKLLLDGSFGVLTTEQVELGENILEPVSTATAYWCALDVDPELDFNLPTDNLFDLYGMLRNEGLTPLFKIQGFAEVLAKQEITEKQKQVVGLIIQQSEIVQECWWYPEYQLRSEEE